MEKPSAKKRRKLQTRWFNNCNTCGMKEERKIKKKMRGLL